LLSSIHSVLNEKHFVEKNTIHAFARQRNPIACLANIIARKPDLLPKLVVVVANSDFSVELVYNELGGDKAV